MSHNVCESCGGVSDTPGVCQTDGCEKNGQELKACDCTTPENHKKTEKDDVTEKPAAE